MIIFDNQLFNYTLLVVFLSFLIFILNKLVNTVRDGINDIRSMKKPIDNISDSVSDIKGTLNNNMENISLGISSVTSILDNINKVMVTAANKFSGITEKKEALN